MPGPPPKREAQRRRANIPKAGEPRSAPAGSTVEIPPADEDWHPVASQWYRSLAGSGQSVFYESGDWATAYAIAESMSREFSPQPVVTKDGDVQMLKLPPKAAALAGWLKGMSSLMVCEGDRRRVGLELERAPVPAEEGGGDVSDLDERRLRLAGGAS